MSKRSINTDKSWWAKTPNRELELLELAGLTGGHKYDFSGHYGEAMKVYYNKKQNSAYIQKSVIMKTMKIRPRRSTTINKVLSNPWLFYTMPLHENSDVLLQPIFDMTKMTETRFNNMLKAVYEQNMKKLLKLCPNILPTPEEYSKGLYSEEEMSDRIDLGNAAKTERQEAVARQAIDRREPVSRQPRDTQNDQSLIIGTRRDIEGEKEIEIEIENKSYNQNQSINKDPIVERTEPSCLIDCDKKIDFTDEIGLKSWKDYLDNLKLDSKEAQCLLNYAYGDSAFFESNFDKFKEKLWNIVQSRGKYKEQNLLSNFRKNGYIVNLLRNGNERNRLIDDIKRSQTFKIQNDFRHQKEGYKWDLFNKDGDRMSGGRIIPRDAPPQPSPYHRWNFDLGMWYR